MRPFPHRVVASGACCIEKYIFSYACLAVQNLVWAPGAMFHASMNGHALLRPSTVVKAYPRIILFVADGVEVILRCPAKMDSIVQVVSAYSELTLTSNVLL